MRKYFKAVQEKEADGWIPLHAGNSNLDEQSWVVDTNSLQADQVPEPILDAKTTAQFVSGLLNLYFNNLETKGRTTDQVMKFGEFNEETESIPHPSNPTLFPDDTK